jgi:Protein of unknown function (DUF3072)
MGLSRHASRCDVARFGGPLDGHAAAMEQERNPAKDPSNWTTGDEPMTGPQASYLETLCREAGEEFDSGLTKAEASKRIDELQARTNRGQGAS